MVDNLKHPKRAPKKPPLPNGSLISAQGKASAHAATLWRILSACGIGIALVGAAHIFGAYIEEFTSEPSPTRTAPLSLGALAAVTVGILFTFIGAVLDLATGTVGARKEEQRLRRRILTAAYEGVDTRSDARSGTQPADVVADLTDNAERVSEFRVAYWGTTLAALIVPMLTLAYIAIAISPFIGLLLLAAYPLVPLIVGGFMSVFRKRSDASRNEREILSGQYLDAIRNLAAIRLLGAGARVEKRLREQGERNRNAIMRLLAGNQIVIIILDGAVGLLWITLAVMLTYSRFAAGAITLSQALAVVFLIILLLEPIAQVAGFFYVGMGGIASGKKISAYLREREVSRRESGVAAHTEQNPSTCASSAICVTNLSFSYNDEDPILSNVSMHVNEGERVALVGASGSGKSTLLAILSADIHPDNAPAATRAEVEISGVNLAAVTPAQARSLTAVVAQRTWLFTGTIASNLRIAAPDATDEQLWAALEYAHLADDVRRMPEGLQTDVGERGTLLSGGQAQRLSIARAFLSGRRVWILDEPTAQVDKDSEQQIAAALADLPSSVTTIVSTHRPALLALVDRAYEICDQQLVPVDPQEYAARLTGDGEYSDMHYVEVN